MMLMVVAAMYCMMLKRVRLKIEGFDQAQEMLCQFFKAFPE